SSLSAYDRTNFKEDPAGVIGSKGGKSLRYVSAINPFTGLSDWPGWFDGINPTATPPRPPLEEPHYLEIDLGSVRALDEMYIFQHQYGGAIHWDAALKDIYIEYKLNVGDDWTQLGGQAYRIHNWVVSDGVHPVEAPPANQLDTHDPFTFPTGTQAQFVRIVAAGPIGDADPTTTALQGNWGSTDYWGCADIALYEPAPVLSVDPNTLEFGYVPAGTTPKRTFTIGNTGTKVLTVASIDFEGSSAYTISGSISFTVEAGATRTVEVTYAPTVEGQDDWGTRIVVTHNASGAFYYLTAYGTAVAPATPSNPDSDIGAYEARELRGR
ncbi:MAG TPA: choice-of-anchor D domain-containing protein, partial [Sumerlaeia bacterium]|nr:choice-of-anchor D domain-containing protein [Sumerlaeia bacterium]